MRKRIKNSGKISTLISIPIISLFLCMMLNMEARADTITHLYENTNISSLSETDPVSIDGDLTLNIDATKNLNELIVSSGCTLTITGTSDNTLTVANANSNSNRNVIIIKSGNIVFTNVVRVNDLTIENGNVVSQKMIDVNNLLISGGTVNATSDSMVGICGNNSLKISGGNVTASGYNGGLYTGDGTITISGGTVIATGTNKPGIYVSNNGSINITGGDITADGTPVFGIEAVNDGHGTVTATPTTGAAGTAITLSSTPDTGYVFKEWQVENGGVTITNNAFTMPSSHVKVKAIFEGVPYTITMTDDGHGTATTSHDTATVGTEITLTATPDNGYEFKEWQVESGGVTVANSNSSTTTFNMGTSNVSIKAIFEKKSVAVASTKDTDTTDNNSGNSDSNSKEEPSYNSLDDLRNELKQAIAKGGNQTVYWNWGTSLSYDIMKTLQDNSNLTLNFKYKYMGTSYDVTIPGKAVTTNVNVQWYGPINLYNSYGRYSSTKAVASIATVLPANGTYTVQSGETLSGIAIKLNTSIDYLVKVNNIPNKDKIRSGQILKY